MSVNSEVGMLIRDNMVLFYCMIVSLVKGSVYLDIVSCVEKERHA